MASKTASKRQSFWNKLFNPVISGTKTKKTTPRAMAKKIQPFSDSFLRNSQ